MPLRIITRKKQNLIFIYYISIHTYFHISKNNPKKKRNEFSFFARNPYTIELLGVYTSTSKFCSRNEPACLKTMATQNLHAVLIFPPIIFYYLFRKTHERKLFFFLSFFCCCWLSGIFFFRCPNLKQSTKLTAYNNESHTYVGSNATAKPFIILLLCAKFKWMCPRELQPPPATRPPLKTLSIAIAMRRNNKYFPSGHCSPGQRN